MKLLINVWTNLPTVFHTFHTTQNIQKLHHFGISWPFLESPSEMHSNKYKHAWYWFINSWNRPIHLHVNISEIWESKHNLLSKTARAFKVLVLVLIPHLEKHRMLRKGASTWLQRPYSYRVIALLSKPLQDKIVLVLIVFVLPTKLTIRNQYSPEVSAPEKLLT